MWFKVIDDAQSEETKPEKPHKHWGFYWFCRKSYDKKVAKSAKPYIFFVKAGKNALFSQKTCFSRISMVKYLCQTN
jgi:hypothetical protein